ncbi:hypothetical protein BH24GEM1_BH24GEM1_18460 [soil metagenome]
MSGAAGDWDAIDRIFAAALERPESQRENFLSRACAGDSELQSQVRALLRSHDEAPLILGESATAFAEPLLDQIARESADVMPGGHRIGPYRIVREIGRGGMGTVYLAEREDEFRKQVAIKLVKRGMDTDEVLLRFRYERQILAALEHPNIARLYDGGMADDGRPYLVMEHVEGRPITEYCDAGRLGIEGRLVLFRTVCQAVQFAHRNLVVHRDVKPTNILVAADGTPKLLDFGIAKLLAEHPATDAPHTRTGMRILTPEYAAPEQIRGGSITTATDVYALGVLLYQLLAGVRPLDFTGKSSLEAEQAVLDQEPVRLSAAAPPPLRRRLRGDLDSIARKAIEKEPEHRYQSAQELLDDIDRHLSGLPVHARRATAAYRLRSYLRRHRTGVAAAATFLLLVAGFVMVYNVRVTQERDRARAEAAKANATTEFVTGLFADADPDRSPGDTLNVFEILDRGAARLDSGLTSEPDVRGTLQATLGRLYLELGDYRRAMRLLDSALVMRRVLYGDDHEEVARALRDAAEVRTLVGDYAAGDSLYLAAAEIQRRRLGGRHPELAITLNYLADMLAQSGRPDEAEPLFREALGMLEAAPGDQRGEIAMSKFGLGVVKRYQGRFDEAEPLFREVLELRRQLYGNVQTDVAVTLNDLGILYLETGRYDSADAALRESLAIRRKLFGDFHREVAQGLNNLAFVPYEHEKDFVAADSLWREALSIWERLHGRYHRDVGMVLGNLGSVALDRGDPDSAETLWRAALDVMVRVSGEESADAARMLRNVGIALERQGAPTEAEPLLRRAVGIRRKVHGDAHVAVAHSEFPLAQLLRARGEYEEAERLYLHAMELWRSDGGEHDVNLGAGLNGLGRLRLAQRRPLEAESLHRAALDLYRRHRSEVHQDVAVTNGLLGAALAAEGRYAEAEPLLLSARSGVGVYERAQVLGDLAALYAGWGKRDDARAYADSLRVQQSATHRPRGSTASQ